MKKTFSLFLAVAIAALSSFHRRPLPETWNVTTVAGWEDRNTVMDGRGLKAMFTWQVGNTAFDASDNLYIIDQVCLRQMDPQTNVTTLFGMGAMNADGGSLEVQPSPGTDGICIDKENNIYVSNRGTHMIYKIKPDHSFEPYAGDDGYKGKDDGNRLEAGFNGPTALCIDKAGNIYVADTYNSLVRKIAKDGKVTTLAGNGQIGDFKPGTGKAAQFSEMRTIAVDSKGNVYVGQNGRGSCVAKITPAGVVTSFAGDIDALLPSGASHDGTGKAARFKPITALAVDKDDNLLIADRSRIRKATPAGVVTTLAGGEQEEFRDAAGAKARFTLIGGISIDSKGAIYISDQYCIRKMEKQP